MSISSPLSYSLIKLRNAFVFPDVEPAIIIILYGLSGIYGHLLLWSSSLSLVTSSKSIIFVYFKNNISKT